jgi:hypothetical protein
VLPRELRPRRVEIPQVLAGQAPAAHQVRVDLRAVAQGPLADLIGAHLEIHTEAGAPLVDREPQARLDGERRLARARIAADDHEVRRVEADGDLVERADTGGDAAGGDLLRPGLDALDDGVDEPRDDLGHARELPGRRTHREARDIAHVLFDQVVRVRDGPVGAGHRRGTQLDEATLGGRGREQSGNTPRRSRRSERNRLW